MNLITAIEKYFSLIASQLSAEEFALFLSCSYTDMHKYHFSLGTWIRNQILSNDSVLVGLFFMCGYDNFDDMSAFMLELFYIFIKTTDQP